MGGLGGWVGVRRWVTCDGDEIIDLLGVIIAASLAVVVGGATGGKQGALPRWAGGGGAGIVLSCGPSFCQPHPFDGGAFTLVHGRPSQSQR